MTKLSDRQIVAAFNEWMREYTEDPYSFEVRFREVMEFLEQSESGPEPTYGQRCLALLRRYAKRLDKAR